MGRREYSKMVAIVLLLLVLSSLTLIEAATDPCTSSDYNKTKSRCEGTGLCLWYIEGGVGSCHTSPYCSPLWSQSECEQASNIGACVYQSGVCQMRSPMWGTINSGRNCRSNCSDQAGTYNGNAQCSFCGSQGFCCDIAYPNGCVPDLTVCNGSINEFCCAVPAATTPCQTITDSGECGKAIDQGCLWYGGTDGCQLAPYCSDTWSQTQCESLQNSGACVWVSNVCRRRPTPLSTVNTGVDCSLNCTDPDNYDFGFNNQCSFCGTAGICCNPNNPVNCLPDATACAGKDACCAVPGTWGPTKSPTKPPTNIPSKSPTIKPSKTPTTRPSVSPTTSKPTSTPSTAPSKSPTSSVPSTAPSASPTVSPTLRPTTAGPSLAPTMMPTFFGSVVALASTTSMYEPDVHGSQAFFDFVCNIFTTYWFPSSTGCDTSRIHIRVNPHEGTQTNSGRRLDTTPLNPNVDITFNMATIPENVTAVQLGHAGSNDELRKRCASSQFKIIFGVEPPAITQTDSPAGVAASSSDIPVTSWMYIGIGIGCFGLFMLLAVILVLRHRRSRDGSSNASDAYRRRDIYIPPRNDDVLVVRADEFRTVPPSMSQREYVAEEAGGAFSVSSHDVVADPKRKASAASAASPTSDFRSSGPQKTKSFHRTMSQRSDRSEDRRSLSRKDSRKSAGSARSLISGNESDPAEGRSREDTLYKHQLAPYFSGRNSLEGDELDSSSPLPQPPPLRSPERRSLPPPAGSDRQRGEDLVAYTSGRHGMSDWI